MDRIFWKRFIGALLIAFLSLQFTRLIFFVNLQDYFDGSFKQLISAFALGIRFDAVTISYFLGPFFIVLPFLNGGKTETAAKWYFFVTLGAMNFLNCADAEFFKFTARRSTDDLFEFAFLSNDIFNIAPNLIATFWYLLLAFAISALLGFWALNTLFSESPTRSKLVTKVISVVLVAAFLVLGARGGFQSIPLTIIDASKTDQPQLNAVVLSTPFTILKTLGKPELAELKFEQSELSDLSPIVEPGNSNYHGLLANHNVVILIVESLSKEYVGALNGLNVTYTPFIDSLCEQSLVFENAFANGHRSIEGIASIMASIPTLMYEPYSTSRYAGNRITSLASLLKPLGYSTSFIHGGNKNSMNFESFAGQAAIETFYDRDDYPFPDEHYDGTWGISDHYMLNHSVELLSDYQKPFLTGIFTLSSHHPYTIPENYQNRFPEGTLPIHESLGYTDESVRQFFDNASKTDWYENTLFVITADHASLSEHPRFQSKLGSLSIPVIVFHPNDTILLGRNTKVIQQIDIMPTILDLLGYDKPFFAFGKSAFDTVAPDLAVAFKQDQHQLFMDSLLIGMDKSEPTFVYKPQTDILLHRNLLNDSNVDISAHKAHLKTFMLNYNRALKENKMTYESWSEY